jgi:hypothetical protein
LKDVTLTPASALPEPSEVTVPLMLHPNDSELSKAIDPVNAMNLDMVISTPFCYIVSKPNGPSYPIPWFTARPIQNIDG